MQYATHEIKLSESHLLRSALSCPLSTQPLTHSLINILPFLQHSMCRARHPCVPPTGKHPVTHPATHQAAQPPTWRACEEDARRHRLQLFSEGEEVRALQSEEGGVEEGKPGRVAGERGRGRGERGGDYCQQSKPGNSSIIVG